MTDHLRNQITSFRQEDDEAMHEAWERYIDLFRCSPMHGLPEWTQVSIFYNFVNTPTRMMLHASVHGTLLDNPPRESLEILDKLAQNDYQHPTSRRGNTRRGPAQLDSSDTILAQIASLTNMVKNMQKQPHTQEVKALDAFCDQCGSNHDASKCGHQVESSYYVGNYNKNNMSNTYNPAWRNHPNFSWKNQNNTLNPQQPTQTGFQNQPRQNQQPLPRQEFQQPTDYKSLENTLTQFMAQTSAYMARTDRFIQKTDAFMDRTEMKLQNHDATLKSLETQVGQISQILSSRPIGGFPSDTEVAKGATHEQCNAITTRSGKILKNNQGGTAANPSPAIDTPAEADEPAKQVKIIETHKPPWGNPQQNHHMPNQQVHINLPLVEALQQMPNYAKFLNDMVTRKKQIEEFETAAATETCLALMHNKVPAKKTDPDSFTIECFIGHNYPTKALCDPGASINLMPKFVFQKLGIGEANPTIVMLQLADHSYVQSEGKIEDIVVQVDKFIFPIDFLILDSQSSVSLKKGGIIVISNEKNELIPTRTITGWRVCMDYRKLNKATRKDHFPLPYIDQMLDRLAGKQFYYFLDGYSGYNQIAIAPEDQSKTTFTCPYGTFAFRRMPFGLCNAPATFQRCMTAIFSNLNEDCLEIFMDDFSTLTTA
ncbi:hypothetical protein GQ457_15G018220 [Hibiscus cannabinus]